jgi:hypothetical protein
MDKIRILLFGANPNGDLKLDEEFRSIRKGLNEARYREMADLDLALATRPSDLIDELARNQPHIVHFSGHGLPAKKAKNDPAQARNLIPPGVEEANEAQIVLVDEQGAPRPVNCDALAELFRHRKGLIRLVVLNACYTREQASAIRRHIDCVVGTNRAIGDKAARVFSPRFYRSLAEGGSVQEAFNDALIQLQLEGIPEAATLELATRPGVNAADVVLFPPKPARASAPESAPSPEPASAPPSKPASRTAPPRGSSPTPSKSERPPMKQAPARKVATPEPARRSEPHPAELPAKRSSAKWWLAGIIAAGLIAMIGKYLNPSFLGEEPAGAASNDRPEAEADPSNTAPKGKEETHVAVQSPKELSPKSQLSSTGSGAFPLPPHGSTPNPPALEKSSGSKAPASTSFRALSRDAVAALLTALPVTSVKGSTMTVGLWIAAPIIEGDVLIFESLAESMQKRGACLTNLSVQGQSRLRGLDPRIMQVEDPRAVLTSKLADVVIVYGISRYDAVVPDIMKQQAPTRHQMCHLALVWSAQARKDGFLILPPAEPNGWSFGKLAQAELVYGEDAFSAANKSGKVVRAIRAPRTRDFDEFFGSVSIKSQLSSTGGEAIHLPPKASSPNAPAFEKSTGPTAPADKSKSKGAVSPSSRVPSYVEVDGPDASPLTNNDPPPAGQGQKEASQKKKSAGAPGKNTVDTSHIITVDSSQTQDDNPQRKGPADKSKTKGAVPPSPGVPSSVELAKVEPSKKPAAKASAGTSPRPLSADAQATLLAALPSTTKSNLNVALWIAAPILRDDVPIFQALAEAMVKRGASFTGVSPPMGFSFLGLNPIVSQVDDPRKLLESKLNDVVIVYGISRDDAVVPDVMKRQAPTRHQLCHLALVWSAQAGKDGFLILPPAEPNGWEFKKLTHAELVSGEDAFSAASKHGTVVRAVRAPRPRDFDDFFGSVSTAIHR